MAQPYLYRIDYAAPTNAPWRDAHQVVDGETPPEGIDLTGSSWIAHFRRAVTDMTPIMVASTANGRQSVDADGKLAWNIPAAVLAEIGPGTLIYDRLWTRVDGVVVPFATGTLTIHLGVTRT